MKLFNVIVIKDCSSSFDLFNQTQIVGSSKTLEGAIEIAIKTSNKIIGDINPQDNNQAYVVKETEDKLFINIEDNYCGDYYNILIKEFEIEI